MMPSEMGSVISSPLGGQRGNPIMATLKERSEYAFALVERRLGEAPYFAGNELTAADVMIRPSGHCSRSNRRLHANCVLVGQIRSKRPTLGEPPLSVPRV